MRYMMLIYGDQVAGTDPAMMSRYGAFIEDVEAHGLMGGGEALQGVSTAKTVRVRNGAANVTDGPFAETKEQLGGYFILDCADLAQALEYAAKIPGAAIGSVEVRPILEMGG